MKNIAISLITGYQRYISPYKGFSCAYRVATGEHSCSGYGKKVIQRFGLFTGYALLRRRFHECKICSNALNAQREYKKVAMHAHPQHGFVDCDCGGADCNIGDCGGLDCSSPCDNMDCAPDFCAEHSHVSRCVPSINDACCVSDACSIGDCGGSSSSNNNEATNNRLQQKIQNKMQRYKDKNKEPDEKENNNDQEDT